MLGGNAARPSAQSAAASAGGSKMSEFKVNKFLGKGSYGSVNKVQRISDSMEYAMKEVKIKAMNQKEREEAVNEIRLLASVQHPNVVRYHEAFVEDDKLFIVTEYCGQGDLFDKIGKQKARNKFFEEDEIWSMLLQMLFGLRAIHNSQILHRDLKSPNIFVSETGVLKIGDLGVAKVVKPGKDRGLARTQVGTPYYVSPEIWKNMAYDTKSDIWSLGVLLYELATFKRPFEGNNMKELAQRVLQNQFKPLPSFYSKDLSDLVRKLLQTEPALRPTVNAMLSMPSITRRLHLLPEALRNLPGYLEPSPESRPEAGRKFVKSTIKVPRNLHQIHLPSPCYPSALPEAGAAAGSENPHLAVLGNKQQQHYQRSQYNDENCDPSAPVGKQQLAGVPPPLKLPEIGARNVPVQAPVAEVRGGGPGYQPVPVAGHSQQQQQQPSVSNPQQQQQQQQQQQRVPVGRRHYYNVHHGQQQQQQQQQHQQQLHQQNAANAGSGNSAEPRRQISSAGNPGMHPPGQMPPAPPAMLGAGPANNGNGAVAPAGARPPLYRRPMAAIRY